MRERKPCQVRPLTNLPLMKGVGVGVPSLAKQLGLGDSLTDKDTLCWLNQELLRC